MQAVCISRPARFDLAEKKIRTESKTAPPRPLLYPRLHQLVCVCLCADARRQVLPHTGRRPVELECIGLLRLASDRTTYTSIVSTNYISQRLLKISSPW